VPRAIRALARLLAAAAAAAFGLQIALAFLGLPTPLTAWLGGRGLELREAPRYVVVAGGSGIPSETGLMRTYYAGLAGTAYTDAVFVVCLPAYRDPAQASVGRMRQELALRGIPDSRIRLESAGMNTHEQAANVRALLGDEALDRPVLIVTSPYHVRRAVLCFRKAGFSRCGGLPAHTVSAENDMDALSPLPFTPSPPGAAGEHPLATRYRQTAPMPVRYWFWQNLSGQVWYFRELGSLVLYWMRGWI
jgi:uncharacterized SAM-binding protein YcdF (DUF218 family)